MQRALVHQALSELPRGAARRDPGGVRRRAGLIDRRRALADVIPSGGHRHRGAERLPLRAQRRLIFEEFFLFQPGLVLRRRRGDAERKPRPVVIDDGSANRARRVLPFKLTGGQREAARAKSSPTCSGRSR